MTPMTFRQRLLAALNGEPTDVLPWFADLTYWYHARRAEGTLPAEYEGDEGFVRLHVDHHVGYYLGYTSVFSTSYDGCRVEGTTDGDRATTRWVTPVGEILGVTQYLPLTHSGAWVKWPVETPEDLRVLRYLAESTVITRDYSHYERQKAIAGDQGHPSILPPRSPVSAMLAEWSGATNLAYLLADAREEVESVLTALGSAADGAYEAIIAARPPFIEFPDNLTGEVVTRWFERYQFDYYVRRIEALHGAGIRVGTHLDGTMRGILPLLVRTGLDYIESITPKPTGDVAIADLRQLAGPDVILFGGMPGALFAPPFGPDDVRRHVEEVVAHHWGSNRFILGVADQLPPNGDIGLVRLVGDLCEELCR